MQTYIQRCRNLNKGRHPALDQHLYDQVRPQCHRTNHRLLFLSFFMSDSPVESASSCVRAIQQPSAAVSRLPLWFRGHLGPQAVLVLSRSTAAVEFERSTTHPRHGGQWDWHHCTIADQDGCPGARLGWDPFKFCSYPTTDLRSVGPPHQQPSPGSQAGSCPQFDFLIRYGSPAVLQSSSRSPDRRPTTRDTGY